MFCAKCGHEIVPEGAMFCKNCGAPVVRSGAPEAAANDQGAESSTSVLSSQGAENSTSVLGSQGAESSTSVLGTGFETTALDAAGQEYGAVHMPSQPAPMQGREASALSYDDDTPTMVLEVAKCALRRMGTGEVIELSSFPFVVGKGQRADYVVEGNDRISDAHAQFSQDQGLLAICDLYSSNGTTVNGRKLNPAEPVIVIPGTTVQLADELFMVEGDEENPDAAAGQGIGGLVATSEPVDFDFAGFAAAELETQQAIDYLGCGALMSGVLMAAWIHDSTQDKRAFTHIANTCATGALRSYGILGRNKEDDRSALASIPRDSGGGLDAMEDALVQLFSQAGDDAAFEAALKAPQFATTTRPHAIAYLLLAYENSLRASASPAYDAIPLAAIDREGVDGHCLAPVAASKAEIAEIGLMGDSFKCPTITAAFRREHFHKLGNTALMVDKASGAAEAPSEQETTSKVSKDVAAGAAPEDVAAGVATGNDAAGMLSISEVESFERNGIWVVMSIDERTDKIAAFALNRFKL